MHVLELIYGNTTVQLQPRGRGNDSMVPLWFGDKMFSDSLESDINSDYKENSEIDSNRDSIRRVCEGAKRQGLDIGVKAIACTPFGDKKYRSPVRIKTGRMEIDELVTDVVSVCAKAINSLHAQMDDERKRKAA